MSSIPGRQCCRIWSEPQRNNNRESPDPQDIPLASSTKWHLGNAEKFRPQQRGYDEFFGFLGGAHPYFTEEGQQPIFRGNEEIQEPEYLTDAFAREAVSFIDRHKEKPFFLQLTFNAVHTPMHSKPEHQRGCLDRRGNPPKLCWHVVLNG
ncbi:MAG: sulfatase-like hydrolase/transferase [Planctomycetaceae bacterium]